MGQWRAQPAIETSPSVVFIHDEPVHHGQGHRNRCRVVGDTVKPSECSPSARTPRGRWRAVTDEDLREWGLDPDDFDTKELPEFMQ
ncbi:type II toxin-antitoxin system HicB family antitoxin [Salinigranum sp. GCM10025319]|uniref:type II toxin-antitoxin system HicB family antitoxin n=1 Tax=Salinigranum sp. GCM10025319 TaxID=3252687 RepID=UPI0036185FD7